MEKNKTIRFSKNWNGKLFNNNYTTIRAFYYQRDTLVDVFLANQFHHTARVKEVLSIKLNEVPEWLYLLDTGLDRVQSQSIIKQLTKKQDTDIIYVMVLQKEQGFLDKGQ